jgi:hypothetical protein
MFKMIKRLKGIGNELDHMEGKGDNAAQMRAYLNQEGYTDRHIQKCARDLVKVGFIHPMTAETLGLRFTREEKSKHLATYQHEFDRDASKSMGESNGCAGILVAFLGLTGLALSIF